MDKILVTSVTPVIPIDLWTTESGAINGHEVSGLLNRWLRDEIERTLVVEPRALPKSGSKRRAVRRPERG